MKKYCRFAFAFVVAIAFIFAGQMVANSAVPIPEKVKVGLYFGSNAVSSFTISGANGLRISSFKDNSDSLLFEEPVNTTLTIKKDDYFHIQIGKQYADFKTANTMASSIKAKGIDAFVTYCDGWFVWSGSYIASATAQTDIENKLIKTLGAGDYIIATQKKRIAVEAGGVKKIIFDSTTGVLRVSPKTGTVPEILSVSGKAYRGSIEVSRQANSDMTVINNVLLDQYIYGVVPNEIGYNIPAEALKAQAIAARNFAIRKISEGTHASNQFDVCAGTHCQVYGGYEKEDESANKAIDATTRKVLTYQGQIALTVYSASNGGMTEASENVWYQSIPYLKSVKDEFDPAYSWEKVMTAQDIKNLFGGSIGDILEVKVTKYALSGRALELVVKGSGGIKTFTKESCRTAFGLKSQMFTINTDISQGEPNSATIGVVATSGLHLGSLIGTQTINKMFKMALGGISSIGFGVGNNVQNTVTTSIPKTYIFSGKGSGHAIGMSQEGVKSRAKAGMTYDKILSFYYPGTVLE